MDTRNIISCDIPEACRITGLGRTTLYNLINTGRVKAVTVGRRRLVLVDSLRALIEGTA